MPPLCDDERLKGEQRLFCELFPSGNATFILLERNFKIAKNLVAILCLKIFPLEILGTANLLQSLFVKLYKISLNTYSLLETA